MPSKNPEASVVIIHCTVRLLPASRLDGNSAAVWNGHVTCVLEVDSAHRVVSSSDISEWRKPRGRPQVSWLEQVDRSCRELSMDGKEAAWRLLGDPWCGGSACG